MKIDELCAYAIEHGFDSVQFQFKSVLGGYVKCKWLDAYMALFTIGDSKGFTSVKDWKEATNDIFDFTIISDD